MTEQRILIIAGPNGSGKTTIAPFLRPLYDIHEAVNPDLIADGLSLNPQSVAVTSGRMALKRLDVLIRNRQSFFYETTLASHTVQHLIEKSKPNSHVILHFMALRSVEIAIQRVKTRVRQGGHDIPEPVIRRRFQRGLVNFFTVYRDRVDDWVLHHAEERAEPVAYGGKTQTPQILNPSFYNALQDQVRGAACH